MTNLTRLNLLFMSLKTIPAIILIHLSQVVFKKWFQNTYEKISEVENSVVTAPEKTALNRLTSEKDAHTSTSWIISLVQTSLYVGDLMLVLLKRYKTTDHIQPLSMAVGPFEKPSSLKGPIIETVSPLKRGALAMVMVMVLITSMGCTAATHPPIGKVESPEEAHPVDKESKAPSSITPVMDSVIPFKALGIAPDSEMITQASEDVDGDGKADAVALIGKKNKDSTIWHDKLWIVVQTADEKWLAEDGKDFMGYEGSLQFGDINGDHINDVLAVADSGGSGNAQYVLAASFAKATPAALFQEDSLVLEVSGTYKDDFRAEFEVAPLKKKFDIDILKDGYDQENLTGYMKIYSKNGKLLDPVEPWAAELAKVTLTDTDQDGKAELETLTALCGTCHADQLGILKSVWTFENGKLRMKEVVFVDQGGGMRNTGAYRD